LLEGHHNDSGKRDSDTSVPIPQGVGQYNYSRRDRKELTTSQIIDATVIQLLFGWTGALHFYLGRTRWGVLYFFTFGLFGVGWLYDFIRLKVLFDNYNERAIRRSNGYAPIPHLYDLGEAYACWLSFGIIGGHQLYLGNIKRAILYKFTLGGLGVLFAIDFFLLPSLIAEANENLAIRGPKKHCCSDDSGECCSADDCAEQHDDEDCCDDPEKASRMEGNLSSPMSNNQNSEGIETNLNDNDTLVVKSTTVYTARDQVFTTDTDAVVLSNAATIPFAYPVEKQNQQSGAHINNI